MNALSGGSLPEMSFRGPKGRGLPQTLSGRTCLAPEDDFRWNAWGIPLSPLALLGARFAEHPEGAE